MKDRVSEFPNRRKMTDVITGDEYIFDVTLSEGNVSEAGTPFAKSTILTDATASALGLTSAATPNDAFAAIASKLNSVLDGDNLSFPLSGIIPTGSISISANGAYDVTSYASAIVSVPQPSGSISISANGTYDVSAFANAVVNVPQPTTSATIKLFGDTSVWAPSYNVAGFREIIVSLYSSTSIASGEFANDMTIYDATFNSVSTIGSSAFFRCSNIGTANFPNCKLIEPGAFTACANLKTISFPECEEIGSCAFEDCESLESASFPKCSLVGSSAFECCSSLSSVALPSCTYICDRAFSSCSAIGSISLPMCTYVSAFAFYSCSNLSSISLPACEIIGKQALIGTALSVLVLPVTSLLGSYALEGLTSLYLLSSEMCDYQAPSLFNDDELSTTIYVPASLYSEYLNASKWVYYWENGATLASI